MEGAGSGWMFLGIFLFCVLTFLVVVVWDKISRSRERRRRGRQE